MDPLSDVLALLKPKGYLSASLEVGGDWSIRFENSAGTIKCYAVMRGACWLRVDGIDRAIRLTTNDCFIVPNGRSFTLASDLALRSVPAEDILGTARQGSLVVHNGGGGALFAGTRFDLDVRNAALLDALPPIMHFDGADDRDALRWSIERVMAEVREDRPGAALAAGHLAHLMLLQALRPYLSQQPDDGVGWFQALADPRLTAAIAAMHADPSRRWALAELAAHAGMSRSIFAHRFRERVGETPIADLARWRMLLAAERLAGGRESLARIAQSLGYQSESAFGIAFKRMMGRPPRRYARARTSDIAPAASGHRRAAGPGSRDQKRES